MAAHWAGVGTAARTFAIAGVIALSACAPRQKPPVAPPPPPPEEKPAPVAPGELHRIAILVPLTGPNAPVGISLANAATLALVDSGKTGLRLTSYDTAQGAGAAAQRALADGAQLILGPLLAGDAPAVKAAAEPRGITMLSFSNDAGIAGGRLYVLGYQPAQAVTRVVDHAAGRGARRFAALVPEGVYGQRASVAFTRAVQAAGGQVVSMTTFARQPAALVVAARRVTDHEARVRQAAAAEAGGVPPVGFDSLLIADSAATAAAFGPHLQRFGAPPGSFLMLGTELWATEGGLGAAPALRGALFAAVPDRRFQQMAQRYRARFGGTPSRLASLAYDATLLAVSAAGGPWQPGSPFPQKLLEDPQGFAGVDGIFRFRGQVAERGLEVQQVTAAGTQTVSPAPASFR